MRTIIIILVFFMAGTAFAQNPLLQYTFEEKIRTGNPAIIEAINTTKQAVEGDEIKITNSTSTDVEEGEPYIAINPTDSMNIVISFMQLDSTGVLQFPVYSSFDGGESWTLSNFDITDVLSQDGYNTVFGGGDPLLAFDNTGQLYFGCLYLAGESILDFFDPYFIVYWASSNDGVLNFEIAPDGDHIITTANVGLLNGDITNGDGVFDRPWFATDKSGGTCEGTLYVSGWFVRSDTSALPSGMVVRRKLPGATAFESTHTLVSVDTLVQFGNVQTDNQGNVHVSYGNIETDQIMYARSTDCGQTFSTPVQVGAFVWDEAATDFDVMSRDNPASSLGIDPATGNPHIVWTSFESDTSRAYYARSTDGGATWETTAFSDLIPDVSEQAYLPNLAVSPSGKISISWYDLDGADAGNYAFTESVDGGATFAAVTELSMSSTPFIDYADCGTGSSTSMSCLFFGDYFGSARTDCSTYSVWSDGRDGQGPKVYVGITSHCNEVTSTTDFHPITDKITLQSIYPNPVADELYVEIDLAQYTEIELHLYDTQGRKVKTFPTTSYADGKHQISLQVSDYPKGIYLLMIESEFGTITKHFVKK